MRTPAFLLYLFLIFGTFTALWRLRRKAKEVFKQSWILNYCAMFESSMVAFVVGSTFLSRAQFDLFYHLVAIVMAFEAIALPRDQAGAAGRRGRRCEQAWQTGWR